MKFKLKHTILILKNFVFLLSSNGLKNLHLYEVLTAYKKILNTVLGVTFEQFLFFGNWNKYNQPNILFEMYNMYFVYNIILSLS